MGFNVLDGDGLALLIRHSGDSRDDISEGILVCDLKGITVITLANS